MSNVRMMCKQAAGSCDKQLLHEISREELMQETGTFALD